MKNVIFCAETSSAVSAFSRDRIYSALQGEKSINLIIIDDLPWAVVNDKKYLQNIFSQPFYAIVGPRLRAIKWLLHSCELRIADNTIHLDIFELTANEIINQLAGTNADDYSYIEYPKPAKKDNWVPWFPVIDYERCVDCGQCLNFCLFDVYERTADKKVKVRTPQNCKNHCPACARVCPKQAIIFPLLQEKPFDGSPVVGDAPQIDMDELLNEDVYELLRNRRKRRTRLLAKDQIEQALAERKKCSD